MLKEGGKLYLHDVVFSFDIHNFQEAVEKSILTANDPKMKQSMLNYISEEFSTMDWAMEKIIQQAGFDISCKEYKSDFFATYLCSKK
ncbi:MAG: hypothetical protein APG12_00499 [Candidatus Methanofastidiosum methylothiophilum]|uniref:Uncharacterized protein n=1 Tax=Candidatus Methanofastidiosum methylothiophilum TaxID=1705564 RepID=A0A150IT49_9EURY|nr:MAG: hypothetical protein APG10_00408 [Candidatus Methanofastidiosum methylthiophilus]KYC48157.1 MAG: hypothetical protein APG11_00518 [Candidatus Methanofastidiosum methylthiophilus]KYC50812.1 MAG: hypothetical protein APG12_00499 [Candidatus Methanofastidiosum methylthiophilus]